MRKTILKSEVLKVTRILILKKRIRSLVLISLMLSLGDAVCTAGGISLGFISEGNVLLRPLADSRPIAAALTTFAYTGILLSVVYKLGTRCRFTVPLLIGVCIVKLAVMGIHLLWMLSI